jgi:hypothetical protein
VDVALVARDSSSSALPGVSGGMAEEQPEQQQVGVEHVEQQPGSECREDHSEQSMASEQSEQSRTIRLSSQLSAPYAWVESSTARHWIAALAPSSAWSALRQHAKEKHAVRCVVPISKKSRPPQAPFQLQHQSERVERAIGRTNNMIAISTRSRKSAVLFERVSARSSLESMPKPQVEADMSMTRSFVPHPPPLRARSDSNSVSSGVWISSPSGLGSTCRQLYQPHQGDVLAGCRVLVSGVNSLCLFQFLKLLHFVTFVNEIGN